MVQGITQIILRLLEKWMEKPRKPEEKMVRLHSAMLWVGIVCTALFLIPGLLVPLATGSWETWPFLGFAVLSASLIIAYCNCRIWYSDEEFTVKFFPGYRRTFSYGEIAAISRQARNEKLKVRGHTVYLGEMPVGKEAFLAHVRKQYRIVHGGKAIPEMKRSRWDPFNGHVDNPGEFVFMYLLLLLFLPGTILVCYFVTEPTPMEEMAFITSGVEMSWVSEDDETDLVIRASGTEMEIWGYEHTLSDAQAFVRNCREGEIFTIGYRTVTNDDGEVTCFSAEYIQDSRGELWITPETARNNRFREVFVIFAVLELFWLMLSGISIYVGRNPHKFSKRVIRLFFKDGYVH